MKKKILNSAQINDKGEFYLDQGDYEIGLSNLQIGSMEDAVNECNKLIDEGYYVLADNNQVAITDKENDTFNDSTYTISLKATGINFLVGIREQMFDIYR